MNYKSKAVLYAALGIIGIVGASTSAGRYIQGEVNYQLAGDIFIPLDPAQKGQVGGWGCVANPTITCTYRKIDSNGPTVESNMTRACAGIFVNL